MPPVALVDQHGVFIGGLRPLLREASPQGLASFGFMNLLLRLVILTAVSILSVSAQSYPTGQAGPSAWQVQPTTNDPQSQYNLAGRLWIGKRVARSEVDSLQKLQAALKQGHALATHDYGVAVYWGLGGLKADKAAGEAWIRRACKLAGVKDEKTMLEEVTAPNGRVDSPFRCNTLFGRAVADAARDELLKKLPSRK